MCQHLPSCPPPQAVNHRVARVVVEHWDQGWGLLCNGVVIFDDGGEFVPPPTGPYSQHVVERPGRFDHQRVA